MEIDPFANVKVDGWLVIAEDPLRVIIETGEGPKDMKLERSLSGIKKFTRIRGVKGMVELTEIVRRWYESEGEWK